MKLQQLEGRIVQLSPYSESFYNGWCVSPNRSDYNIVFYQELWGEFNPIRLESALELFVKDYIILHSRIENIDGKLYWVADKTISVKLDYFERGINKRRALEYVQQPFNLIKGPLMRVGFAQISANHFCLLVIVHHVIMDGSKGGFFVNAFSAYYNNLRQQEQFLIEEQYIKFNEFHTKLKRVKINNQACKAFWKAQLQDISGVNLRFLEPIPLQFSAIQKESQNFSLEYRFSFDNEIIKKLQQLKKCYGLTPYLFGQVIFAILLYQHTGQSEFAIWYPIAIQEGVDFIYGVNINVNVIPYCIKQHMTLLDVLGNTKNFLRTVKRNNFHYYPFQQVVSEVENKTILDVGYIQTYLKDDAFDFHGIEKVEINSELNIDLLCLLLFEQELKKDVLSYRVRYDKRHIDSELLLNFINRYRAFFIASIDDLLHSNINRTISDYSLVDATQIKQIQALYNPSNKSYSEQKTIHQQFEDQVLRTPDNPAVVYDGTCLTYNELNAKANKLAYYLVKHFMIQPDDLILVCLDSNVYVIITILAILKSGAAYVPVSPLYPDNWIIDLLQDTKTSIILSQLNYLNRLHALTQSYQLSCSIIAIDDPDILSEQPDSTEQNIITHTTHQNLAYVIYTSGSTGKPKGVLQQHNNVIRLFAATQPWYQFTHTDSWILFHSYAFDFSVWEIWGALFYGGKLVIPTANQIKDPYLLYRLCELEKITVLNQTPMAFYNIINLACDTKYKQFKSLRYIILGGDRLDFIKLSKWFERYDDHSPKIINMYGITETTVHVTYKHVKKDDISSYSLIGQPIPDQKLYVLDQHMHWLPIGAIGELYVGGAGLARGYLNQPTLTSEKFILNPFQTEEEKQQNINHTLYRTQDLVRLLPNGELAYIGRIDSQVKVRGYRIELSSIENILRAHESIKQSVVILKNNNQSYTHTYLVAYYVSNKEIEDSLLINHLSLYLPYHCIPSVFCHLNELPLTVNGKLNIRALPDPIFKSDTYLEPTNSQEMLICQAFIDVLHVNKIGIQDDFFRFGGDSIQAVSLVARLQSHFNITVSDLYKLKTPQQLATQLSFGSNVIQERLNKLKGIYQQPIQLDEMIQQKRDTYLQDAYYLQQNHTRKKPITYVLLTGVTGYLGINLLAQLLNSTDYSIVLLVRACSDLAAFERVNEKFKFYFEKDLSDDVKSRITVFSSDIEKEDLAITADTYRWLTQYIDSIIHAAALTKHYGENTQFCSANIQATINLLELCRHTKLKDFHYISTISVFMYNSSDESKEQLFTEDDQPDDSKIDNIYIKTKYAGEQHAITYRTYGVNSNIYRVGNLAFIQENGRIQQDSEKSGFLSRLNGFLLSGYIAKEVSLEQVSAVDLTAQAITLIFDKVSLSNRPYHVFNPNLCNLIEIFDTAHALQLVSIETFIDKIVEYFYNSHKNKWVERFLLHQGWLEKHILLPSHVNILEGRTSAILEQFNFKWPHANSVEIIRFFQAYPGVLLKQGK